MQQQQRLKAILSHFCPFQKDRLLQKVSIRLHSSQRAGRVKLSAQEELLLVCFWHHGHRSFWYTFGTTDTGPSGGVSNLQQIGQALPAAA
eukprot:11370-Heterococcus_DN1.PRE.11